MKTSFERSRDVFDRFVQMYGRLPTEVDSDYLELLRMSKYRVLDLPDVKPFKCANCGSAKGDGRQYIDFGLDVEWYGTLFICGLCLKDTANEMGLFQALIDEVGRLQHEILSLKILRQKGGELEEKILHTFKEVKEYFDGIYSISDDSSVDSSPDVVPDKGSDESKSGSDVTESGTTKQDSSKRPTDLRSLAELLNAESQ